MPSFITMASISLCNLTENKHGMYRSVTRFRDPSHCYFTNYISFSSFCVVFKNIYKGHDMCVSPGAFNFVHVQTRVQPKKLRIVQAYLGKISTRSSVFV